MAFMRGYRSSLIGQTVNDFVHLIALLGKIMELIPGVTGKVIVTDIVEDLLRIIRSSQLFILLSALILATVSMQLYSYEVPEDIFILIRYFLYQILFPLIIAVVLIMRSALYNTTQIYLANEIVRNFNRGKSKLLEEMVFFLFSGTIACVLNYLTIVTYYHVFLEVYFMLSHNSNYSAGIELASVVILLLKLLIIGLFISLISIYHGLKLCRFSTTILKTTAFQINTAISLILLLSFLY